MTINERKKIKKQMMDWIEEKIDDYFALNEDKIVIDLRFVRGKEYQHKVRSWYLNKDRIDPNPPEEDVKDEIIYAGMMAHDAFRHLKSLEKREETSHNHQEKCE